MLSYWKKKSKTVKVRGVLNPEKAKIVSLQGRN